MRQASASEYPASVGGDEQVVFDSDSSEIVIFLFKDVEVDEFRIRAGGFPVLDEGRYKIDSRFVSYDMPRLQPSGHPQGTETQLFGTHLVFVVTHKVFAQILHVVYV